MVLHLHLSPAVFDYTDWTWLGKPHTCLYKTLQLTVHVRANENHEVKGAAWRAQRQNCGKAQIWPRLKKKFCCTFRTHCKYTQMHVYISDFFLYILNAFIYNRHYMNITHICVNTCQYFQYIYMHVCLYIHNNYTQNTPIYYVYKNFYFGCD